MTDDFEVERQELLAEATELETEHARLLLWPDPAGSISLSRKLQAHAVRFKAFTDAAQAQARLPGGNKPSPRR